jgi:hypothetical protein
MSLVGRLEDLSLGEILQIVSLSKRSGLLRLESPGGKASLYIRAGKVIYAATSDEKGGVLNLLADKGLIGAHQLEVLSENLESAPSAQAFRELLAKESGIDHRQFQTVLKSRVEELTYTLFIWEEGTFSFQLIEDESSHPVLSKVAPFFLDEGVGAQFLVMEGARRKDEMMRTSTDGQKPETAPMVDPDKVLGDNWEQEFEQHLAGSAPDDEDVSTEEDLQDELDEFIVPENLPSLPLHLSNKVVAIGLQAPLVAEIEGSFNRKGFDLLVHENGADALTRIQELRQQKLDPYLLVDMEAQGITDGRDLGGLEVISTLWDFGFHLPVGLICSRELYGELASKLKEVTGLTIFEMPETSDPASVRRILETVGEYVKSSSPQTAEPENIQPFKEPEPPEPAGLPERPAEEETVDEHPAGEIDRGEDFYDIEQEFSEELSGIDLPFEDALDESLTLPGDVSLDPHMSRLSSYVNELNRQDISGEITLLALRFASAFTDRAILFLVRRDDIKGLGQYGVDLGQERNADSLVRSLSLPLEENSLFHRVVKQRQSYKGPPGGTGTEEMLLNALGGGKPSEIYIGPIVSMGKVAVLLYGDDYPVCNGLEPTHTLDIFLSHVGLALDRAFLEMKLKSQKS